MHLKSDEFINRGIQLHESDELVPRSYMQRARLLGGSQLKEVSLAAAESDKGRCTALMIRLKTDQGCILRSAARAGLCWRMVRAGLGLQAHRRARVSHRTFQARPCPLEKDSRAVQPAAVMYFL